MKILSIVLISIGIYALMKALVMISFQDKILKWVKNILKNKKRIRQLIILEFVFALILISLGIILRNF